MHAGIRALILAGLAWLFAPLPLHAGEFEHNWLEVGYASLESDDARRASGASGRINLELPEDHWLVLEHDQLSRSVDGDTLSSGHDYSRFAVGAGHYATDEGMWIMELGMARSSDELLGTDYGLSAGAGIRTRISPRFELGGGLYWSGVARHDPDEDESFLRVHGILDVTDRVALSGLYEHLDDGFQWRVGLRAGF